MHVIFEYRDSLFLFHLFNVESYQVNFYPIFQNFFLLSYSKSIGFVLQVSSAKLGIPNVKGWCNMAHILQT